MSDKTGIEWTDATWNPVTGCTKVSAGCDHCYAETIAHRFTGSKAYPNGFQVTLRPERLDQPLRWKRPRRIFVNSMADLFHDDVPDEYIAQVFAVMAAAPHHTFQVLTKRHARMRSLLNSDGFLDAVTEADGREGYCATAGLTTYTWPLPNVWLGVSTENQKWANIRIPALLDIPAAVRFISAEPLLGPIDLDAIPVRGPDLDWVIVGGESGPGARPMHPDWARSLRDQCTAAGVPFLFKQWGEYAPGRITSHPKFGGGGYFDDGGSVVGGNFALSLPSVHDFGDGVGAYRIGKKRAGRELDGRTWDQYPATTAAVPA